MRLLANTKIQRCIQPHGKFYHEVFLYKRLDKTIYFWYNICTRRV
nr:MAG TPA: hypothetical protein [Caudoviricetes sp.]